MSIGVVYRNAYPVFRPGGAGGESGGESGGVRGGGSMAAIERELRL
jgi:hypothetical protein